MIEKIKKECSWKMLQIENPTNTPGKCQSTKAYKSLEAYDFFVHGQVMSVYMQESARSRVAAVSKIM